MVLWLPLTLMIGEFAPCVVSPSVDTEGNPSSSFGEVSSSKQMSSKTEYFGSRLPLSHWLHAATVHPSESAHCDAVFRAFIRAERRFSANFSAIKQFHISLNFLLASGLTVC